jgi:hypothetical protein
MFQFPSLPRYNLCIQLCVTGHYSGGVAPFGYPRIADYNVSPRLFAVYCVLHRLLMPRYSPCALCSFTILQSHLFVCRLASLLTKISLRTHSKSSGQRLAATTHYWWNTDLNMQFSEYRTGIMRPLGRPTGRIPKLGLSILPELLVRKQSIY